eukprot:scaffold128710_cov39-Phaeocystis_antarctica.AAC.1
MWVRPVVTHEGRRCKGGEEGGEEAEPRGVESAHVGVGEVEDGHGRRLVLGVHRHREATPKDIHRALAVDALALKALMQRGNLGLSGLRLRLQVVDQLLELSDVLGSGHRNDVLHRSGVDLRRSASQKSHTFR